MKKERKKLGLSRETLRNMEESSLFFAQGAATGTCAGSGCHSCGTENDCTSKPYVATPANPVNPATVQPVGNPVDIGV